MITIISITFIAEGTNAVKAAKVPSTREATNVSTIPGTKVSQARGLSDLNDFSEDSRMVAFLPESALSIPFIKLPFAQAEEIMTTMVVKTTRATSSIPKVIQIPIGIWEKKLVQGAAAEVPKTSLCPLVKFWNEGVAGSEFFVSLSKMRSTLEKFKPPPAPTASPKIQRTGLFLTIFQDLL